MIKQLTEVKPGPPPTLAEQREMVEAAHDIVQEARKRRCVSQRDEAVREQEEAHMCECLLSDAAPTSVPFSFIAKSKTIFITKQT